MRGELCGSLVEGWTSTRHVAVVGTRDRRRGCPLGPGPPTCCAASVHSTQLLDVQAPAYKTVDTKTYRRTPSLACRISARYPSVAAGLHVVGLAFDVAVGWREYADAAVGHPPNTAAAIVRYRGRKAQPGLAGLVRDVGLSLEQRLLGGLVSEADGLEGQVAIVTGAGGKHGLGRAYAMLLAAHGAKVDVNDIRAVASGGRGCSDNADAYSVADEIRTLGGDAVADTHSVSSPEGAKSVVRTALAAFGSLDIVVNNAGICFFAGVDEISESDIELVIAANLFGTIWMCRAALPHMREKGYGRIVNVTSGAAFGMLPMISVYGAAKGGVLGFTKAVAAEMGQYGIKCNAISPVANTRMVAVSALPASPMFGSSPPELVAPGVLLLAHPDCPVNGEVLRSVDGKFGRVVIVGSTKMAGDELFSRSTQLFDSDGLEPIEMGALSLRAEMKLRPYAG
jgi:NAD(P)-dependent dehydrogenase (short-subunit alcohol dehydrogenase family)